MKKFAIFCLPLVLLASACSTSATTGCPTNQMCTDIFASIGTQYVDSTGKNVNVTDVTIYNLRTKKEIEPKGVIDPGFSPANHTIVTDANRKELSTEGDNIRVTATLGSRKIETLFKISGGCNCHVEKLSGPEKIVVDK